MFERQQIAERVLDLLMKTELPPSDARNRQFLSIRSVADTFEPDTFVNLRRVLRRAKLVALVRKIHAI